MNFNLPKLTINKEFLRLPKLNLPFNFPSAKKQTLPIGIDIGSHAVKVCELAEAGNGYKLLALGSAVLPPGAVEDGVLQDPDAVGVVIKKLLDNLKVRNKKVAISISGYSVIVKKINLETMSEEEMEVHIHSEAEQYIPFDIDEVYLDFQNLETNTGGGDDRTDVMLVAARKDVVDGYLSMLGSIGLKVVLVDVDGFALENAFEENFGIEDNIALIDIGATKMNINIISGGSSILARDVVLGSGQLSEQIQTQLEISFEEAESLKIGQLPSADKQEALENLFVSTCTQWITEIKRALDFYYSSNPDATISKMVLSGGGARIRGLDQFFSDETGIPVEIFNPFSKAMADSKKIDPEYLDYIAPEMAISVGLAIRPSEL